MDEFEWLACTYPTPMLAILRDRVSHRQFRLFACACVRRIWPLLRDERSRRAVEVAERFADREASIAQFMEAADSAQWAHYAVVRLPAIYPAGAACHAASEYDDADTARDAACAAAIASANPVAEFKTQAALVRDIFGNPFRPRPRIDQAWLAWNDSTIRRIAEGIYEERRWGNLPILADALLDAGCDDDELLRHCRSDGPHVRGCWVVDLILDREL